MGAVRLVSVLIAAVTMDLAGRKVLLYVSGECPHSDVCLSLSYSHRVDCSLRATPKLP